MLRVPCRRIWIPRSSAADTSMRCHLQLLKLHNICYWDHGGWQSLSESRSTVILRVALKCRSELSSCLPMWHPPILGNLLISQQMLKSKLRTNNKILVCNKNESPLKSSYVWCFRWGKFVYPSSAVPPTDEDLIREDEEQVKSILALKLDCDCDIISIKVGSYSSSTFLGSIIGVGLTVGAAIALVVGCFLYRKSRRFTFIVCTVHNHILPCHQYVPNWVPVRGPFCGLVPFFIM